LSDTYYYIINLVAEDAFCLGTKARVPYMMFAETVRVSGVMFSTMEGKLKEIQTQNQMALRPIPTQPRNNQVRDARATPLARTLAAGAAAAITHQLSPRGLVCARADSTDAGLLGGDAHAQGGQRHGGDVAPPSSPPPLRRTQATRAGGRSKPDNAGTVVVVVGC
jgi:hypothetical protein